MEVPPRPILKAIQFNRWTRGGLWKGRVGHLWPDLRGGPALCGAEGPPLNWRSGDWIPARLCPKCMKKARRILETEAQNENLT